MSLVLAALACVLLQPPGVGGPPGISPEEAAKLESKYLGNVRQITNEGESGESYFSPKGDRIIFQSIRGAHPFYQIFERDLATGKERLISTGAGRTTCAWYHPTEAKLLYASSHLDPDRAAVVDAALRKKAEQAKAGGRQRSYEWVFDPFMDIFECDLDGKIIRRLTDAPGYDAEGSWSPDAKEMVFCSFRKGNGDIWIAGADGSNPRQLTDSPGYDGGPFFSPDGRRIIYRAEVDKPDYLQIFVMDRDGKNRRQLTKNDAVNWGPYWHPDSRHIIFATSLHGHHNYELYVMDVVTAAIDRVTHMPGADVLPAFDATGTKLIWTTKRGKDRDGKVSSQVFMADWKGFGK
jgi:Tol biopolymer transport system component